MKLKSKYRNVKTCVDGIRFDSKREAEYYAMLKLRKYAGEIVSFELQKPFPIIVNGIKICTYKADFVEYDKDGNRTVIDVKGFKTPVYNLKKKLMKAVYGIDIIEA